MSDKIEITINGEKYTICSDHEENCALCESEWDNGEYEFLNFHNHSIFDDSGEHEILICCRCWCKIEKDECCYKDDPEYINKK
jgi:hypothetical protein